MTSLTPPLCTVASFTHLINLINMNISMTSNFFKFSWLNVKYCWICCVTDCPPHKELTAELSKDLLGVHCSLLTAPGSVLTAQCSVLIVHCSLPPDHCSLLTAQCSLPPDHCSLINYTLSLINDPRSMQTSAWPLIQFSAKQSIGRFSLLVHCSTE